MDAEAFTRELETIRVMEPRLVLSSHLPAAPGDMTDRLGASLEAAMAAQPFLGPDQAVLEELLAPMTKGPELAS